MEQKQDSEQLARWAEVLRDGLGLVRFGDLPVEELEYLLDPETPRDLAFWQVFVDAVPASQRELLIQHMPKEARPIGDLLLGLRPLNELGPRSVAP